MTERCEHCRGRGFVTVEPRLYEWPPFKASCYGCAGTGLHPDSFSLSLRGEKLRNECLMESEHWAREYADTFMSADASDLPDFSQWVAEQKAIKAMEDAD